MGNPVGELTTEQLRDEVAFWRADCAARLATMRAFYPSIRDLSFVIGESQFCVSFLTPTMAALRRALAGDYHEACEACGEPLRAGQPVFQAYDGGEIHAACLGEPSSSEGFVGPDGEPLPPGPAPLPYPYDPGFDAERIERELASADALLAAANEDDAA